MVFWAKLDPIWAKCDPSGQFVRKVGKSALELGEKNSIMVGTLRRGKLLRSWRVGMLEGGRGEADAVGVAEVAWVEVCVEAVQAGQGAVGRALGLLARAVLFFMARITVGARLLRCA